MGAVGTAAYTRGAVLVDTLVVLVMVVALVVTGQASVVGRGCCKGVGDEHARRCKSGGGVRD